VLGGAAGAAVAASCTAGTAGVCALGAPAIVAGGITAGAALGQAVAKLFDWMGAMLSNSESGGEGVRGLPPDGVSPPVDGEVKPGPASRPSEQKRGGQSLWDDKGGEWRYFPGDRFHNPHWDHNSHGNPSSPWTNIDIGGLPSVKPIADPKP